MPLEVSVGCAPPGFHTLFIHWVLPSILVFIGLKFQVVDRSDPGSQASGSSGTSTSSGVSTVLVLLSLSGSTGGSVSITAVSSDPSSRNSVLLPSLMYRRNSTSPRGIIRHHISLLGCGGVDHTHGVVSMSSSLGNPSGLPPPPYLLLESHPALHSSISPLHPP